jgi:hypothetical protein
MNIVPEKGKLTPKPASPEATVAAISGLTPDFFIHGMVIDPTAAVMAAPMWAIAPKIAPATVVV